MDRPSDSQQASWTMSDHTQINWFHSIDLGNGVVTKGLKSRDVLQAEFHRMLLTEESLKGRRVLDIGCNDGFMSLACERLGADVVAIDGVATDGLKLIRKRLKPRFRFYAMDLMSPSFYELGRFDVILYSGIIYHTPFPFEQLLRLATACKHDATAIIETAVIDIPGREDEATLSFNFNGTTSADLTSPCFPSVPWMQQALARVGFSKVEVVHRYRNKDRPNRGRATIVARFDETAPRTPFLFASTQV
jgi:tRNA (mo5U34)-methyltransferase